MNDETRKLAITIAAAIFAAGALTDWDGKRSPFLAAGVANAVEKAKLVLSMLDLEGESIRLDGCANHSSSLAAITGIGSRSRATTGFRLM